MAELKDTEMVHNWRNELYQLFAEYAGRIMFELFEEIRQSLERGKTAIDLASIYNPEVAAAREEVFGSDQSAPQPAEGGKPLMPWEDTSNDT